MKRSTPERRNGTETDVVGRRALAYVADAVALLGLVARVSGGHGRSRGRRVATILAVGGSIALPYHVLFEGAYGQTVGKRLLGIVVVSEDGTPCTYTGAAVRTALRFVDWLPAGYFAGLVSIALTDRHQRLGDLLAGTVVVRDESAGYGSRTRPESR